MQRVLTMTPLLLLALVAPGASAQEELPGLFDEVLDVRVVNLEVVVTDRSGNRVTELGPESFRLRVDGEEVPIDYFTEIQGGVAVALDPSASGPKGLPAIADDEPVGTSYLVFVDDFFAIARDRNRVLQALREDLARLGPADRMAIVAFDGRNLDMLTSWADSSRVLDETLRDAQARPAYGLHRLRERQSVGSSRRLGAFPNEIRTVGYRLNPEEVDYAKRLERQIGQEISAASSTLRSFARPPGRKVMLLLSGGWPYDPAQVDVEQPVLDQDFLRGADLFQPLVDTANLLGYTLYPVDVPGLQGDSPGADEVEPRTPGNLSRETEIQTALGVLARETGGRALLNSNNVRAFERTWEDTRSYYWLGYTPDRSRDDRPHEIEVDVVGKGLRARSRRSFLDFSRQAEVASLLESTLLFGNSPAAGALPVKVGEIRREKRRLQVPLTLAIPVDSVTLLPTEKGFATELELRIAVRDERGGTSDIPVIPIRFDGEEMPAQDGLLSYETSLTLRDLDHEIVVAVFDPATGKIVANRFEIAAP